jgi:hypothetical protein
VKTISFAIPVRFAFALPVFVIVAATLSIAGVEAQISYVELSQGDLGPPDLPTDLDQLSLGTNTVTGQLQNRSGFDPDAFSFLVPEGLEVSEISMSSLTGDRRFLAINEGPVSQFSANENLFTTLIGQSDVGTNILSGSLNSFGGLGMPGNLGPGRYTVWFQETDGFDVDYSFAITTVSTATIPEPSAGMLLSSMLVLVALKRPSRL